MIEIPYGTGIEALEELVVPEVPRHILKLGGDSNHNIIGGASPTYVLDHLEYPKTGGVLVYMRDCHYPKKGWPYPEAVLAIYIAKRMLIEGLKTIKTNWLSLFHLWRIKNLEKLLDSYNRTVMVNLECHVLKPEYEMLGAREIRIISTTILERVGISKRVSDQFGIIVSSIVEYDDAYRFRLQDLFSETTQQELMENPRQVLLRLSQLVIERDHYDTENNARNNILLLLKLARLVLLLPSVKQAFTLAIFYSKFSNLQLDESDIFWGGTRSDYDLQGKTFEQHQISLKERNIRVPQAFKVTI